MNTDWKLIFQTWTRRAPYYKLRVMPSYTGKFIGQIYDRRSAEVVFEKVYEKPWTARRALDQKIKEI